MSAGRDSLCECGSPRCEREGCQDKPTPREAVCHDCEQPLSEVRKTVTGVCPTHGVVSVVCGNPKCWCSMTGSLFPRRAFDAFQTLDVAITEREPSHVFALFSGGHDSLCSTAVAAKHPRFTAAVHINTGVGIEATRTFVRETCEAHGWPLIEMHPDAKTYRDLVAEKGMPGGPKAHNTMYYWLKQRQVRRLVRDHKQHRHGRIALVTGIRVAESQRRMSAAMSVPVHRIGAQVWINPILDWTKRDCNDFMQAQGLPRNQVVDLLHRSGECLCGALAHASEIKEIERWYPEEAATLHGYEALAAEQGHPETVWAGRLRKGVARQQLPLCVSCEAAA